MQQRQTDGQKTDVTAEDDYYATQEPRHDAHDAQLQQLSAT